MRMPDGYVVQIEADPKGKEAKISTACELILCKNCKHFVQDVWCLVDKIPLIVGHEMCNFWGDGCKTTENGWCSYAEPKESNE